LADAGDTGLTVGQLVHHNGHSDAHGILKRLAGSDSDWRSVLRFPDSGSSPVHFGNPR